MASGSAPAHHTQKSRGTSLILILMSIQACLMASAMLATAVPTIPLHNAAQPGQTMPLLGIGTGGYGNASGYNGEHWDDTYVFFVYCVYVRVNICEIFREYLYRSAEWSLC